MTEIEDRPDPLRQRLFRSVFEPSPLESVAEAVSVATENERRIYVERVGSGWRWSLTHAGGPYPLLRITARFLRVDHRRIAVGFRTAADGVCVLCADPGEAVSADAWAVIDFDGAPSSAVVRERILQAFGPDGRVRRAAMKRVGTSLRGTSSGSLGSGGARSGEPRSASVNWPRWRTGPSTRRSTPSTS